MLAKQVQPLASELEKPIPIKGPAESGLISQAIGLRIGESTDVYKPDRSQLADHCRSQCRCLSPAAAAPFIRQLFVERVRSAQSGLIKSFLILQLRGQEGAQPTGPAHSWTPAVQAPGALQLQGSVAWGPGGTRSLLKPRSPDLIHGQPGPTIAQN